MAPEMASLRSRLWRPAPIAGLLATLTVGSLLGPNLWVRIATRGRTYASVDTVPARVVAIVPGSPVYRGNPGSQVRTRLEAALGLYRSGRVKAILVSGNDIAASPEVSVMFAWLLVRGVPARDILTDEGGTRTRETMRRAAGIFDVRSAIVCTQDIFMPRSLYLAREAGIDAVGLDVTDRTPRTPRREAREALKTTLAVVESQVREGPTALAAERTRHAALAAR
jgi:vancomycin permeability regulator SanA